MLYRKGLGVQPDTKNGFVPFVIVVVVVKVAVKVCGIYQIRFNFFNSIFKIRPIYRRVSECDVECAEHSVDEWEAARQYAVAL